MRFFLPESESGFGKLHHFLSCLIICTFLVNVLVNTDKYGCKSETGFFRSIDILYLDVYNELAGILIILQIILINK